MNRMFRAWPVLTLTALVPASLLALPVAAFAQRSSGSGSGSGSQTTSSANGSAPSGGGSASSGGHAGSGGGAPSGGGSASGGGAARSGGSSGEGRSSAARWSGGGSVRSGTAAQARAVSAQGPTQGAVNGTSNAAGRMSRRVGAFQNDVRAAVPPFSRPRMGTPIGQAVPRTSVTPPFGGGTNLSYVGGYPGNWAYGFYGYGGLSGLGFYDSFGLGGFGGFGGFGGLYGFDPDYSGLGSFSYGPGYGRAYGTYDPYERSFAGFGSSGPESDGTFTVTSDSRDSRDSTCCPAAQSEAG